MKNNIYKIYEVNDCSGEKMHVLTGIGRIFIEQLVMDLNKRNIPNTSYCYYDNAGICYTYNDILTAWGLKK